ncbi:MAG: hypothetical protein U5P41_09170 [Gammaproteobacteria bacterium]|nr:hypothetical protein [Gammaproteobacteria bacterium]
MQHEELLDLETLAGDNPELATLEAGLRHETGDEAGHWTRQYRASAKPGGKTQTN